MADQAYIQRMQRLITDNNNLKIKNNRTITQCQKKKIELTRRKQELERIRNNVNSAFHSVVDEINAKQREFTRKLERAAESSSHTDELVSVVGRDREETLPNDRNGFEILKGIADEIGRCEGEISRLDGIISECRENINSCDVANRRIRNLIKQERSKK